ncbi:MAG: hypothetical protein WCK02_04310 [Bacteroidota bacterium]
MKPKKYIYTINDINLFCSAIMDDEEKFSELLSLKPELAAFCDFVIHGNENAFNWLNNYRILHISAFISALNRNKSAIDFLIRNDWKVWAATANAFNGSVEAESWLDKYYFSHYKNLAHCLRSQLKQSLLSNSEAVGSWGTFSDSGSSGGFDFGGGDFGGAGGGSDW